MRDGLVIVNYGKTRLVEDRNGNLHRCVARRALGVVVCGDRVIWEETGEQAGVISAVLPRQTVLGRGDASRRIRPLAANIEQLIVVAAAKPVPDRFLIDKYLLAAELIPVTPVLVINKADLLEPGERNRLECLAGEYAAIGYSTLFTSALRNTGIESFTHTLADRTSILVGQSGVGKSSLVRRLLPDREIAIGKLSQASGQGRHTTTATTLYHLPHGGHLIDSPGVRDFHPGRTTAEELAWGFPEFRPWLGQCKFSDCRHLDEPQCAFLAAEKQGKINKRRLESYRQLMATITS
ncbi:MAG: ribosome small subunit-dependent GTPase A [Gammaproteobacteria bacterium]|jgi:ribosome biogenesis GTPase